MLRLFFTMLALIIGAVAQAQTPNLNVLRMNGRIIPPIASWSASSLALPAWLSVSRAGNATMIDSTGKLTFAPNNLFLSSATYATRTVTVVNGINYVFQAYGPSGATIVLPANCGGATWTGTGAGNLVTLAFTSSGTSCVFPSAGGTGGSITSVVLCAVTYQTSCPYNATTASAYYAPRFDYDAIASPNLLLENTVTSYLQFSNAFSSWTSLNNVLASSAATSVDGTTDAWSLTDNSSNGNHAVLRGATTLGANVVGTDCIYAQQKGSKYLAIEIATAGGVNGFWAEADLNAGTIVASGYQGSGTLINPSITSYGGGIYRVCVTGSINSGSGIFYQTLLGNGVATSNASLDGQAVISYAGSGANSVYIFGSSLENQSFPSSYIVNPTSSLLARAADSLTSTYSTNPVAVQRRPESSTNFVCTAYASMTAFLAAANDNWIASVKVYPVLTALGAVRC